MLSRRPSEFSRRLLALRTKSGKSRYKIAQYSGLDGSYVHRLESGEKRNPSRDTVMKLGFALVAGCSEVTMDDVNALLLAAGYAPIRTRGERGSEY